MYEVREVTDLDDIIHLYGIDKELCEVHGPPNQVVSQSILNALVELDTGVFLGLYCTELKTYVGLLIAVISPDIFSGILTSQAIVFYVLPEHRGKGTKLYKDFIKWSKLHKAS